MKFDFTGEPEREEGVRNSEAGMSKTYSENVYGWLRLRSTRQVKLKNPKLC